MPGGVVLAGRGDPILCSIPDLSRNGARLRFNARVVLPSRFTLILFATAERCEVELRWARGWDCGVRFLDRSPGVCWGLISQGEAALRAR
jgi:PilZ domain